MGEFDDVLAMEPGDEWDDYEAGVAPAQQQLRPLAGELLLPGAVVQLRGEVPLAVMRLFGPLRAPVEDRTWSTHLVTLTFDGGSRGHEVVDLDRGTVGSAATVDALVDLVVEHLLEVSATLHRSVLQLRAAALQLPGGSGVLVVDDDRSSRHAIVAALVARGARCVSPDRGVLAPGSRTAQAFPLPVRVHGVDGVPERFAPAAQISAVVWVTRADGGTAGGPASGPAGLGPSASPVQELTRPHGCGRLLVDHLNGHPDPEQVVHAISDLAAAASFWSVTTAAAAPTDDAAAEDVAADSAAAAIVRMGAVELRPAEVVTVRRLAADEAGPSLVRFADGGVLVDPGAGAALELAEDELRVLDQIGWRGRGVDRDELAAVLEPLASAGIDLRSTTMAPPIRLPGVESFGLPGSPAGIAAATAWSAESARKLCAAEPRCAPAVMAAVGRGEIVPDDITLAELSPAAGVVAARARAVMDSVRTVVAALHDEGIAPILLGDVVAALDGPLPAEIVPVESMEMLVGVGLASRCVETLETAGGTRVVDAADAPPGHHSVLWPSNQGAPIPIGIHERLAGGPFGELVDHDDLVLRSVPLPLGDRFVRGLHPDDRFIWACICAGGARRPQLHELRQVVLASPRSRSTMASALEVSAQWGATRTVLAAVGAAAAVLPGVSPWLLDRSSRSPDQPRRRRRGPGRV